MRILSITAGAAGMYCGSCFRDNALAAELMARGHDVTLVPVYTPTTHRRAQRQPAPACCLAASASTCSSTRRSFGRRRASLDRLLGFAARHQRRSPSRVGVDRPAAARRPDDLDAARASAACCARSSTSCSSGLRGEPLPDVVNLPNSLLIAMAGPLRARSAGRSAARCRARICFSTGCDALPRAGASRSSASRCQHVDRFIAVSDYCAAS